MYEKVMIEDNPGNNYGETIRTNLELKKFNWGAFGFTVIWGLFNGLVALKSTFHAIYILCIWIFLCVFFGKIGLYTATTVLLGFMIYCGLNGNQWAYSIGRHDLNDFVKTQYRWGIAYGIFVLILGAFILQKILIPTAEI